MKIWLSLAALALVWPAAARGLKGRGADVNTLEAENEALKKRNKHLEAMMQVARTEVHRMDEAVQARKQHHDVGGSDSEVADVDDLKKKLQKTEADKKALVKTLREMLAKNSTKLFKKQAQEKHALEVQCGNERVALQGQIKEANGKCDETKEMAQTLQDQNMDLQRTVHDLRAKLASTVQKDKDLVVDKANLVDTMHNLMRENTNFKQEVQVEAQKEKRLGEEISADQAKLAKFDAKKMKKKLPVPAVAKTVGKKSSPKKHTPLRLNHEESMAAKIAKMRAVNRYIDHADMPEVPADDLSLDVPEKAVAEAPPADQSSDWASMSKQVDAFSKQEDLFAKGKLRVETPQELADGAAVTQHSKGLSDWLGLKVAQAKSAAGAIPKDAEGLSPIDALDPDAVKQELAAQATKVKTDADDGGDGIQDLLSQAKDQLAAMDSA